MAPVSRGPLSNGEDIALLSFSCSLSLEGGMSFVCRSLLSDGGVTATSLSEILT